MLQWDGLEPPFPRSVLWAGRVTGLEECRSVPVLEERVGDPSFWFGNLGPEVYGTIDVFTFAPSERDTFEDALADPVRFVA
jgi:hypothetical protein